MCYITATELKNNLSHYMELSQSEDIYVTKNNKVVTVLTSVEKNKLALIESTRGFLGTVDKDIDYDELLKKEIMKRCGYQSIPMFFWI